MPESTQIYLGNRKKFGRYISSIACSLAKGKIVVLHSRGRLNSLSLDISNMVADKGYGKIAKIETNTVRNPKDNKKVSVLEVQIVSTRQC